MIIRNLHVSFTAPCLSKRKPVCHLNKGTFCSFLYSVSFWIAKLWVAEEVCVEYTDLTPANPLKLNFGCWQLPQAEL